MNMKTRVYKYGPSWAISYYLPYSGMLIDLTPTWEEAMAVAWEIEKQRPWS